MKYLLIPIFFALGKLYYLFFFDILIKATSSLQTVLQFYE